MQACGSLHQNVCLEYRTAVEEAYNRAVGNAWITLDAEFTSVHHTPTALAAWKERVRTVHDNAKVAVSEWTVAPEARTECDEMLSSLAAHGKKLVDDIEKALVSSILSCPVFSCPVLSSPVLS
jgi:hypothetical protein